MRVQYDETQSLRDVRARYFRDNGFGDDGGYSKAWVPVQLGPVTVGFPNSAARVRAVKFHDLHHVVTGYPTDAVGEAEIGAWEAGSGCGSFVAAWVLNAYATAIGFLAGKPRALWAAFVRGRHTHNLYQTPFDDDLLDARLGEVRTRLRLDGTARPASFGDRLAFAAWSASSLALAAATIAVPVAGLVWLGHILLS
jgi:hypothetical protein